MMSGMRIVAVEEHLATREMRDAWARLDPTWQDDSRKLFGEGHFDAQLDDLADARIRRMDASGVDVAVLSLTTPGVQNLDAAGATLMAHRANNLVAQAVRARPDRFEGFATLPTPSPTEAARELDRAVTVLGLKGAMLFGRTRDRNMDDSAFLPIYEAAAHLRVPLYIHPQIPQRAVRDVYYSGFGAEVDLFFATGGLGWHLEAGIQFLRLVLSGVFDRYPDLQVILGHWGEVLPFYLERIDVLSHAAHHLRRPVADYVRENVYVSPSGILSQSYLSRAIEVMGADRILFSTDDPYVPVPDGGARRFLEEAAISPDDKAKIAHGNWDRLCAR